MVLLASLLLAAAPLSEQVVITIREPAVPERMGVQFEADCRGHSLRLDGVSGRRPGGGGPLLLIDKKPVALSPSAGAFLSQVGSSYRFWTKCDEPSPTFYLYMYRVRMGAAGQLEYAFYRLALRPGGATEDSGEIASDAEGFWYQ